MNTARALAHTPVAPDLVEGEFPFTARDFAEIAALAREVAGIALAEGKAALVYSRLSKRLRAHGLQDFSRYCELLRGSEGEAEHPHFITALTTNVTAFFREAHHFDNLAALLEDLAPAVRAGRRLRLWSAGCSSGQEPYSMALTVLSVIPEAQARDVRILATDIDPRIVAQAQAATYAEAAVQPIPPELRRRWMKPTAEGDWTVGPEARGLVAVKPLNLMAEWPMRGRFDAIFCRNVAIYFDAPDQTRLWSRFSERLNPGGRLYIGHSERVNDPSSPLTPAGLTTYRAPGSLS